MAGIGMLNMIKLEIITVPRHITEQILGLLSNPEKTQIKGIKAIGIFPYTTCTIETIRMLSTLEKL